MLLVPAIGQIKKLSENADSFLKNKEKFNRWLQFRSQ